MHQQTNLSTLHFTVTPGASRDWGREAQGKEQQRKKYFSKNFLGRTAIDKRGDWCIFMHALIFSHVDSIIIVDAK